MLSLQKTIIKADGETLVCEYKLLSENVVILHGAGQANRQRYYCFAEEIIKQGKGVIIFDFSGHGQSSGAIAGLTLNRRIKQASAVIDTLLPAGDFYLAGFSMSGQTVCDLLPIYTDRIKGILLACAAAYRPDIYDIPFGSTEFTARLHQGGWQDTRSKKALSDYRGHVVFAMGAQDTIIPNDVTQLLRQAAGQSTYVEYPDAGHQLAAWLADHPGRQKKLIEVFLDR